MRREVDHRYLESATVRRLALSIVPVSSDIVVLHTDDITERQRTEEALRASEQKYRTIVDTAHDGILAVDIDSVTTYVNQRAAEMLGYEPDEMLGVSVFDFIDESLHEEARQMRARRHAGVEGTVRFSRSATRRRGRLGQRRRLTAARRSRRQWSARCT